MQLLNQILVRLLVLRARMYPLLLPETIYTPCDLQNVLTEEADLSHINPSDDTS